MESGMAGGSSSRSADRLSGLGASIFEPRDRELRADDGLEPGLLRGAVESRRAVDAVAVEQRQRRIAQRGGALDERLRQRRASRNEKAEAAWSSVYTTPCRC